MPSVLVVGLNPAWQQIVSLPRLVPGTVHRARRFEEVASGKGLNAARALTRLGHSVALLQILAGERGARIAAACEADGIRSLAAAATGETRVCVTLAHDGTATEVIAPFAVPADEGADLGRRLLALLPEAGRPDALLICGSVPDGVPPAVHADIVARAGAPDGAGDRPLVVWDSVAGLTDGALARIDWLKINAGEYDALALRSRGVPGPASLLITDGAAPASVRTPAGTWTCAVPRLDAVVSPIGAGDAATAALTDALLRGRDARAAAGRALSAAAASCLVARPAAWDETEAARIEGALRWEDA